MNFVSVVCPHCGKELQLPEDAGNIVCMYCAKPIDARSLRKSPGEAAGENYGRLIAEAESLLSDELFCANGKMSDLKRSAYPEQFEAYQAMFRPALQSFSLAATEYDGAARQFAQTLFERFLRQFERDGLKKENDSRFFDFRYMIVAFTVPAILELHTMPANDLADCFLEIWNEHYPKNRLGKADYDTINNGFRKRLCFITTAVCTSLGKGDGCAELNTFRNFRDGWLAGVPGGPAKISEYYLFAPFIVRAIDRSGRSEEVYRGIWETYLEPCLCEIASGKPEACAGRYEQMVLDLEQDWL